MLSTALEYIISINPHNNSEVDRVLSNSKNKKAIMYTQR